MKFRTKKTVSVTLIFILLLYPSYSSLFASQSEMKKLVNAGKTKFYEGKFSEAIEILNDALIKANNENERIESHFYLGVCWIGLNIIDKAEAHFIEIIKINPEYKLDIGKLPPEIENIFERAKAKYPMIYNLFLGRDEFYPYINEKPSFQFSLTSADCVNLYLKKRDRIFYEKNECFYTPGNHVFEWDWKDEFIESNNYDLILIPDKNKKEYSFGKKLYINTFMPKNLAYENSSFHLMGRKLLPENIIKKSYPKLLLWSGMGALFGYGAYLYFSGKMEENNSNPSYYLEENKKSHSGVYGTLCVVVSVVSLIEALTPKKTTVAINENIKKNSEIKKEIENLKKKIKVKQEIHE